MLSMNQVKAFLKQMLVSVDVLVSTHRAPGQLLRVGIVQRKQRM